MLGMEQLVRTTMWRMNPMHQKTYGFELETLRRKVLFLKFIREKYRNI